MQNLRFGKILTMCTFMQNLWLKVKNTLTSSVILYWKARLVQNSKFKVVESNVDNLYSHANPQVKCKKKSSVIHQWKAQVMVNPKLKILTNFGNIYFHAKYKVKHKILPKIYTFRQNIRLNIKSSVIHQWKAMTVQNPKCKVWSIFFLKIIFLYKITI